jgi:hypothetical protein
MVSDVLLLGLEEEKRRNFEVAFCWSFKWRPDNQKDDEKNAKKKRRLKLYFCGSSNKDRKSYQLLDLFFFTRCLVKENPTSLEKSYRFHYFRISGEKLSSDGKLFWNLDKIISPSYAWTWTAVKFWKKNWF